MLLQQPRRFQWQYHSTLFSIALHPHCIAQRYLAPHFVALCRFASFKKALSSLMSELQLLVALIVDSINFGLTRRCDAVNVMV